MYTNIGKILSKFLKFFDFSECIMLLDVDSENLIWDKELNFVVNYNNKKLSIVNI